MTAVSPRGLVFRARCENVTRGQPMGRPSQRWASGAAPWLLYRNDILY